MTGKYVPLAFYKQSVLSRVKDYGRMRFEQRGRECEILLQEIEIELENLAAAPSVQQQQQNVDLGSADSLTSDERGEMASAQERDAARYRWLRSEEVATDPRYYPFWNEFNTKLCREEKMDAAIDLAMSEPPHASTRLPEGQQVRDEQIDNTSVRDG